jgi:dienelactone hydrolase
MPDKVTLKEEVVDDALAAAALLRKTDKIDPKRVFVVGHSLGAVAAPRVAELDPGVAGIVLMAGNQRPLEVVMLEQIDYILSLEKSLTPAKKKLLTKMREQVTRLRTLKPGDAVKEGDLPDGAGAGYWLALKAYDQSATASKVRQPVLVLQGERDYQVSMADFAGWKKALAAKKNARLKSYPDLNHLFMTGKGKATPEEYARPGHVAEKVVDDIAVWVKGK